VDFRELAAFLRRHRERISPGEVGLPGESLRRTPGLRREEVAARAHISVEYYTRLEQARASRPSRRVLGGLATALRLDDAQTAYLHHLTGQLPAPAALVPRTPDPGTLALLRRLPVAAMLLDATYEVIAWNDLAVALLEDFTTRTPEQRNLVRRYFLHTEEPLPCGVLPRHDEPFGLTAVGQLRDAAARYPDDPRLIALVRELNTRSADFNRLWASHEVSTEPHQPKTFDHPDVDDPLELTCDALHVPEQDQQIFFYTAEPGSTTDRALRLLA
jgi:transcriptional regulator with XRE-family HTH domain